MIGLGSDKHVWKKLWVEKACCTVVPVSVWDFRHLSDKTAIPIYKLYKLCLFLDRSQSLLFRASGRKGDWPGDPLGNLGMEKYGRFDFSPWERKYLAQNRPKSMMAYAEVEFCLFRFQFHALLRSGEPLFPRWSLKLLTEVFWSFVRPPAGWLRF